MSKEEYEALSRQALNNPEEFWRTEAQKLSWIRPFTQTKDTSFAPDNVHIRWFYDGTLNLSANCIDRHLPARARDIAIIWEGDNPADSKKISYGTLHQEVCKFANVLKNNGVRRGDRVTIYLPMIPEAAYAMLACARIGAIHSVVFAGFSAESLAGRIQDCDSRIVITADEGVRGGKIIPLKKSVDEALVRCPNVNTVLVVRHTGNEVPTTAGRDRWYHEEARSAATDCPPEEMGAEDPLFILYTSGSTGKPKGALHTTAGYLTYAAFTHRTVFDYQPGEIYWCTADVGWITGHSYLLYGPLCNGATTLMFEGTPTYPSSSRLWEVVDKHRVNILYTAPTVIRALMREGEEPVKKTSRASLRVLGTVGEPINPEAWRWYSEIVGEGRCPVVDTWWQTETGGILISPVPGVTPLKAGSATKPLPGIRPALIGDNGIIEGAGEGHLVLTDSWPGQMRTVWGDHARFEATYFSTYPGMYFTGDGARRDKDGDYWITGRVDDVLNVSGHRLGTAEVESALVAHPAVAEAAVVGYPHDIKGQAMWAYVTLCTTHAPSPELAQELKEQVAKAIGPIARPDVIQFAPGLPKTRSGKIMRRILRNIAKNKIDDLGDTSTLADPSVVAEIIENRTTALETAR